MSDWFVVLLGTSFLGLGVIARVCRGGAWSADIGLAHSTTRAVAASRIHQDDQGSALSNAVTQYRCVVLMVLTMRAAAGCRCRPKARRPATKASTSGAQIAETSARHWNADNRLVGTSRTSRIGSKHSRNWLSFCRIVPARPLTYSGRVLFAGPFTAACVRRNARAAHRFRL